MKCDSRFNRSGKIKSQRLVNTLLKAKRENPSITIEELSYLARGFQECQRG